MPRTKVSDAADAQLRLEELRAHRLHLILIYGLRAAVLALAAAAIGLGAVMTFRGLQGSFNWAFEVPKSVVARLTNASPGVIFATIGFLLAFVGAQQIPVDFKTPGKSISTRPQVNWKHRLSRKLYHVALGPGKIPPEERYPPYHK